MKKILTPGTQLQNGLYLIEKHLGGGGFGITYLATWIQGTQTKLKFIRTGEKTVVIKEFFYEDFCRRANNSNEILITDEQKRHEFEQLRSKLVSEANILNSFKHPHIVEVYDVFEENNTAYIVMERVAGEDLEDRIIHKTYCSPDDAVRYISQIALALIEVHSKRVLHLDVSPSNILIDKTDNAQLIDFGISLTYDAVTGKVKQTSKLLSGKKSGFSPPEQSLDSLHHFSPPIDLYALGATLYNALTGHKPPDSGSLSTGAEALMLPSSYNPKVSAFLDFFVLKAMNIRINERFQTAAEFYDVLLNGEQQYTNAIRRGNEYYASGNYHDALTHFEAAFQLINTNDALNAKINRCRLKITEEEEIEKDRQKIQTLLANTAAWFDIKEYEQALSGYQQLLTFKPGDSDITEKIRICQEQINYRHAIKKGDAHFKNENFRYAIKSYQQALQFIENDAYCIEQIKICKANLDETIKLPTGENGPVTQGDKPKSDSSDNRLRVILLSIFSIVAVALIVFFIRNNIPEKTEPEWIAQYERLLSTANDIYKTENYRLALSEYNQALQLIPPDAKNASRLTSDLNAKINDCEQKISEQEKKAEKEKNDLAERERQERERQEKERQDKLEKEKEQAKREAEAAQKLKTLKRDANIAFDAKNWSRAYTLYQEIKSLDPDDYTGYNNFLKTGKELMAIVGCDGNVKDLLTKARNLRNTGEVNDLLKKCN